MKNKLKKMACILTAFFVLALSCFAVPSFASSISVFWLEVETLTSPDYYAAVDGKFESAQPYIGSLYYAFTSGPLASVMQPNTPIILQPGEYVVSGEILPTYIGGGSMVALSGVCLLRYSNDRMYYDYYTFGQPFTVTNETVGVVVQSFNETPVIQVYTEPIPPLYNISYDFFGGILYGGTESLTGAQELTLTIIATFAAISVIAAPFLLCYWIFFRGIRI